MCLAGTTPLSAAEQSPATRLAMLRARKCKDKVQPTVGERMLDQSAGEHAENLEERRKQHLESNKLQTQLLLQSSQEQEQFQEAWSQNMEIMKTAVLTLQNLSQVILQNRANDRDQGTITNTAATRVQLLKEK